MTSTAHTAATDQAGHGSATTIGEPRVLAVGPAGDRQAEYRTLMRKWWFGAAVGVPTMVLSHPWLTPGLRDALPRGSEQQFTCQMRLFRGRNLVEAM